MKYLSAAQTAEKWGVSARRVQILCNEDRIPGAIHVGFVWAIPDDAKSRQMRGQEWTIHQEGIGR